MREGWVETTLGQVATRVVGRTPSRKIANYWTADTTYPFFTIADMSHRHVTAGREGVTEQAIADGQAKRVPAGSLLLSFKLTIGKVVITDREVYPNEAIAWIRPNATVLQDFLALALENVNWDRLGGQAVKGKTLNKTSLDAVELLLPPIEKQHRIVDLMASLDDTLEAAVAARSASEAQIEQLSYQVLPALGTGKTPLSDAFSRSIGGVWGQSKGEGDIDVVAFRSTEFSDWGDVVHKEPAVRSITHREHSTRALEPGDILVEKSGGTPTRPVGRVVQFHKHDLQAPSIGTNFMQIVRPEPAQINARYAYWLLWANHRRGGSVIHQKASTNIRNLQTKAYLQQGVDLPTLTEQEETAGLLDAALDVRTNLNRHIDGLRDLRANLLMALLSGEHEIPESYDDIREATS
ncbi:restriction endonuclease subunit S [Micrococcus sp. FDAARGOS_333]|uniref:restriction endonuclease subunit S n=1 Tax=Micrococcus sp. FDAARGOS_333 TaxID=1930558 RepID=UPI00187D35A7|nr:restriction endonuclease subunit S [Micrococcus sp. FDAARGOS_333]